MSSQQDFFERLKCESLGGEKTDRLERELRAHLEDAGSNKDCLGDPSTIASIYNRVRAQHSAPEWILKVILLGVFALFVQYITVWLLSGMLSQLFSRFTSIPLAFALNPSNPTVVLVYALAFVWLFVFFWIILRQTFRVTGQTNYTTIVISIVLIVPIFVHVWTYVRDKELHQTLFPLDILLASFFLLVFLVVTAFFTRNFKSSLQVSARTHSILWTILIAYIFLTTIIFAIPNSDGNLTDLHPSLYLLTIISTIRLLFEQAATGMLTSALSLLSPPVMWNILGLTLTLTWTLCLLAIGRRYRETRRISLGAVAGLIYLSSILSFGAIDRPDVIFARPVQSVSVAIEQKQIHLWSSLHSYLQRLQSTFPIYHTQWNDLDNVFQIKQSARPFRGDQLIPISSWTITPETPFTLAASNLSFIPPDEPDSDDDTLETLATEGFNCDTDEPFPSCFNFHYKSTLIFSHNTRSIIVTNALVSPDEHWALLTLTMRYSGNEYVYLVDLSP